MAELYHIPSQKWLDDVPDDRVMELVRSGEYTFDQNAEVVVRNPDTGKTYNISPADAYKTFKTTRLVYETPGERATRITKEKFADRPFAAATLGAASGLTLGGLEVLSAWGPTIGDGIFSPDAIRNIKDANPTAWLSGDIAGSVAPILLTAGEGALVKGAAEAGEQGVKAGIKAGLKQAVRRPLSAAPTTVLSDAAYLAERALAEKIGGKFAEGTGAKFASEALARILAYGGEGAVYGVAETVSDAALYDKPLTADRILAGAGLGALIGGGTAGTFHVGGKLGMKALGKAREIARKADMPSTVIEALNEIGDFARSKAVRITAGQRDKLNKKGLLAEVNQLIKEEQIVTPGSTFRSQLRKAQEVFTKYSDETKRVLESLDTIAPMKGLKRISGEDVADIMRKEAEKLTLPSVESVKNALLRDADAIAQLGDDIPFRQANDWLGTWWHQSGGKTVADTVKKKAWRNVWKQGRELIDETGDKVWNKASGKEGAMAANWRKIRKKFQASKELLEIAEKAESAGNSGARRLLSNVEFGIGGIGALIGFGSGSMMTGALAALGGWVAKNRGPNVGAAFIDFMTKTNTMRAFSDGVGSAVDTAVDKIVKRSAKPAIAPVIATKSFFETNLGEKALDKGATPLQAFNKVSDDLVEIQQNPSAFLDRVSDSSDMLAIVSPDLAGMVGNKALQVATFLYDKLPKNPGAENTMNAFVRAWEPSSVEVARFARYYRAATQPMTVLEDLASGIVPREGIEAIRALYPDFYGDVQVKVMNKVATLEDQLPYGLRLELSQLLEIPLEPTMAPAFIAAVQGRHAERAQQNQQPSGAIPGAANVTTGDQMRAGSERLVMESPT